MAIGLWNGFCALNEKASSQQALDYVDQQMEKMGETPNNPRRETATTTERGTTVAKKKGGKLTMADLTPDEKQFWNQAGFDLFGNDKKAFLQSVQDVRKGS